MPITVPTSFLSFSSFFFSSPLTKSKLLAKASAQNVQIVLILKSSCIFFLKNLWHFPLGRKLHKIYDKKFHEPVDISLATTRGPRWLVERLPCGLFWLVHATKFHHFPRLKSDVVSLFSSLLELATVSQHCHFRFPKTGFHITNNIKKRIA